jgi:hypothetical protein
MKLWETYQELGSTFTHAGKEYDLNALFIASEYLPVDLIEVAELIWVFEFDHPDLDRIEYADTSVPILVVDDPEYGLVAVDGLHRTAKAVLTGQKYIKGKMIPLDMLNSVAIDQPRS